MPKTLPPSNHYKHLIRPDGTIRRATMREAKLQDGEIVVESAQLRQPGFWFYDFSTKQLVQYTPEQLKVKSDAKAAARDASAGETRAKKNSLRVKIDKQPPELKEILELLVDLAGIDLT